MINSLVTQISPATGSRIVWLDLARTVAIVAMVVFHFCFDLAMFGLIPWELVQTGFLRMLAVCTAASFLFLAGVGLVVAHGRGIRWHSVARRFAILAGAAAVITLATYVTQPQAFIFFGILHSIAVASILGLAFLRLPVLAVLAASAFVVWLHFNVAWPAFDHPALIWLGLGTYIPRTLDFEPVFPWFGAALAGIGFGQIASRLGWFRASPVTGAIKWLCWPGQQSLKIYIIHQPVLVSLVWLWVMLT